MSYLLCVKIIEGSPGSSSSCVCGFDVGRENIKQMKTWMASDVEHVGGRIHDENWQ